MKRRQYQGPQVHDDPNDEPQLHHLSVLSFLGSIVERLGAQVMFIPPQRDDIVARLKLVRTTNPTMSHMAIARGVMTLPAQFAHGKKG
jgi:hypothetical protein